MKNACRLFILVSGLLFSWQASGANECAPYLGQKSALPEADVKFLKTFTDAVKNRDRKAFLSMSRRDLLYVHVFTESANSRGGDIALNLKPTQIDKELKIHIEDLRPLGEWRYGKAEIDGSGIFMGKNICGTDAKCDWEPSAMEAYTKIDDLIPCNDYKNAAFVFTNGILLTAMQVIDHGQYGKTMSGTAYFFIKTPGGYQLYTLITLQ